MVALEDNFRRRRRSGVCRRAQTSGTCEQLVEAGAADEPTSPPTPVDFPAWNRTLAGPAIRRVSLPTWILPLARVFAWIRWRASSTWTADGPGGLRRQSPEPHGRAGRSCGRCRRAGATASRRRWRRSSSRRTSFPREYGRQRLVHQQPELLPGGALLQRVPAAAAGGRRAADAALHRRAARATASRC